MKLPTPTDIASLAKLISSSECRSIAILTGAGMSVASGIPDFRSPGGMYATLRPELLTATPREKELMTLDPTYVVTWEIFQSNPFPYLEVRRPFILGTQSQQWKPTIAHRFLELLHRKTGKLTRIYTQNIDGLDRHCQIPDDKIVNVHGTLSKVNCEGCGAEMDFEEFCHLVRTNIRDIYDLPEGDAPSTSKPIQCPNCGQALVKPSTVLFGRQLPEDFFTKSAQDLPTLDLLIVAGTSLVVGPANSLAYEVPDSTIRVVMNGEPVGEELGIEYPRPGQPSPQRDFFAQGDCDDLFLSLIEELGWLDDLNDMKDRLPLKSQELLKSRS